MKSLTKMQFLVLAVLLRCPMHPYVIKQEITEMSGRQVWPSYSSVASAIDSLLAGGFIQEVYSDPYYWLKARRGTPYELTANGLEQVRHEIKTYREVLMWAQVWLNALASQPRTV